MLGCDTTSFLVIHYGYDANVMQTVYSHIMAYTFGMMPIYHYGILGGYIIY